MRGAEVRRELDRGRIGARDARLPKGEILPRREILPAEIARRLVELFATDSFEPGQRMPSERQLAEAFGVGRSAMREALKSLTLMGLLDVRQGDGTYLRGADSEVLSRAFEWGLLLGEQRIFDLIEARRHIEIVVARLAAQRRNADTVERLRAALERMRLARGNIAKFVEADIALHLEIAETSGNTAFRAILGSIRALLRAWITRVVTAGGDESYALDEHVPIVNAIERGDADAAARAMADHLEAAAQRLQSALASDRAAREAAPRPSRQKA